MSTPSTTTFTCFRKRSGPQGHYRAARELYDAGIWVGYLAPGRYGESYKGLPSYSELKLNGKKFSPPFPPPISGVACEERHAICRGCPGESTQHITLREVAFLPKTKLVIMPLLGDRGDDLFCIVVTQPNDRSLPGLQAYRPYEIGDGDGQGTSFSNSFVLLALRNTSQVIGTLETIEFLLKPTRTLTGNHKEGLSRGASDASFITGSVGTSRSLEVPAEPLDGLKRKTTGAQDKDTAAKRQRTVWTSTTRTQQPTPASREPSEPAIEAREDSVRPRSSSHADTALLNPNSLVSPSSMTPQPAVMSAAVPSLELTREQRRRLRVIWTVVVEDDVECEFIRGLDECESFSTLLDLLHEDAEQDPQAVTILKNTKLWRLMYQHPSGGAKKAFNIRSGNETAFERFQEALVQSALLNDNPGVKVDVQLRAVS